MVDDDEHVPLDSYAQRNDCLAILNFKVSGEQNQEKQFPYVSERRMLTKTIPQMASIFPPAW